MCAALEKFGTTELKEAYLPRMAKGELRGGIALTEPDCGTDLQAIRTQARRSGNDYVIDGTKQWITNSVEGNVLAVCGKNGYGSGTTASRNESSLGGEECWL